LLQDNAIGALAEAMLTHKKTGFLIERNSDRRALLRALNRVSVLPVREAVRVADSASDSVSERVPQRTPQSVPETAFAQIDGTHANAESAAGQLIAAGCDLVVLWQMSMSLADFPEPGEIVMPTRIVDAESGERHDTALSRMGRRDRAAILSSGFVADPGTRRRMAMRFQCVVMDNLSATLARYLARANVPFLIVCAQIDRRSDRWTNRILRWQLRFGSRGVLSALAWLMFKPRERMDWFSSRNEARMALHEAADLLRECLEDVTNEEIKIDGSGDPAAR
jgi:hypothetical protein